MSPQAFDTHSREGGGELQIVPAVAPLSRVYDAAVHDAGEFDAGTPQGENVVDGLVDDQVCA